MAPLHIRICGCLRQPGIIQLKGKGQGDIRGWSSSRGWPCRVCYLLDPASYSICPGAVSFVLLDEMACCTQSTLSSESFAGLFWVPSCCHGCALRRLRCVVHWYPARLLNHLSSIAVLKRSSELLPNQQSLALAFQSHIQHQAVKDSHIVLIMSIACC